MKTQKEAIIQAGKASGKAKWSSYMSGGYSEGLDTKSLAQLIGFIYGDNGLAIEDEILAFEGLVYDCLLTTGGRVGRSKLDEYIKTNLGF